MGFEMSNDGTTTRKLFPAPKKIVKATGIFNKNSLEGVGS